MNQQLRVASFFVLALLCASIAPAQWVEINDGLSVSPTLYGVFHSGSTLFAGSNQTSFRAAAYRSTNNGTLWDSAGAGLGAGAVVRTFAVSGPNLVCGTDGYGTYRSTNNGTTWTLSNTGIGSAIVIVVRQTSTVLIAGGSNEFWISTNNGGNWTASSSGMNLTTAVTCFTEHGSMWAVGTNGNGAFISNNSGASWTGINNGLTGNGLRIYSIVSIGGRLVAGAFNGGVYVSTNNGGNWTASTAGLPTNADVRSLVVSGNNLLAGTFNTGAGVFLSTNFGTSWSAFNTGMTTGFPVSGLAIGGGYIFASIYNGGAWRRPVTDLTVVREVGSGTPEIFSLEQNYPNPFNPTTTMSFELPVSSFVSLKVYDVLGGEVALLVNENLQAGSYETTFNATALASGVYVYTLSANGKQISRKMLFTK